MKFEVKTAFFMEICTINCGILLSDSRKNSIDNYIIEKMTQIKFVEKTPIKADEREIEKQN